jgi:hypothetical protein
MRERLGVKQRCYSGVRAIVAAVSVVPTFNNGFSGRVNGGFNVATPDNVTVSATGECGGLGDEIRYWRVKASVGVKF